MAPARKRTQKAQGEAAAPAKKEKIEESVEEKENITEEVAESIEEKENSSEEVAAGENHGNPTKVTVEHWQEGSNTRGKSSQVHLLNDKKMIPVEGQETAIACADSQHMNEGNEKGKSIKEENPDQMTVQMLEEAENIMSKENISEEEKIRTELNERSSNEAQEQRYKRLMHLLNKSEFYSKFLLQRIESRSQEKKSKSGRKSKNDSSVLLCSKENGITKVNSSYEENVSSRGRKRKMTKKMLVENNMKDKNGEPSSKKHSNVSTKKSRMKSDSYDISEVLDAETIRSQTEILKVDGNTTQEIVITEKQPELFEGGSLRQYQLEGFSWLKVLFENGVNGILADEMGLGKTIQCIALICHLVKMGVPGPFLVCAPLSTLPNWISEFERFAPKIPCILYHGSEEVRISMRHNISETSLVQGCPVPIFPVIITSYEVVIRDKNFLRKSYWRYICVDEGHRLKNFKSLLTKCLKQYPSTNRLLLTGTPLQNDLSELWSLLNFLLPDIFDSLDVFESWFDVTDMMSEGANAKIIKQERETQVISTLHKILSPFFLRRIKADIDINLPGKKELLVYTPMTELQLDLYKGTVNRDLDKFHKLKHKDEIKEEQLLDERGQPIRKQKTKKIDYASILEEEESPETLDRYIEAVTKMNEVKENVPAEIVPTSYVRVKMANPVMQLRKIVNHPYLIEYPLTTEGDYKIDNNILMKSGKLQVLNQLLENLHSHGHRVLLFSQMTQMLDILEHYLTLKPKWNYKRLDGNVKLDKRRTDIKEFNTDPKNFIYLLSTRAGGLGINLTGADTAIIYDSDWNPQQDLQAQDRCHRIGQTKPVLVIRLVTAATIDERMVDRAATKRKLEKLIIQKGKFKSAVQDDRDHKAIMDPQELMTLLNTRDHDRIHRTKHGNIFTKKELEEILDRSDIDKAKPDEDKKVSGVFKVISIDKK